MLHKNQKSKRVPGKCLAIAPLLGLMLMLIAAPEYTAHAQETTVRGIVKNARDGQPLPATNVVLVGTGQGTTTDAEGKFDFKNVPLNGSLAFSFVGYVIQEVKVTERNQVLNVAMQREQLPLESLVVVGYGPVKPLQSAPESSTAAPSSGKEVFVVVEQMPEFPGGIQEMYKYLAKNIRYPSEAARDDVEGKVVVTFTVSEKGYVRNPQITQRLGGGTDEEVLRVVLGMPSWTPAKQNGRPVPMEYVLPIDFQVEKADLQENKEKRQGFTNFRMPDFKFDEAVDLGLPSHGPDASTIRGMPMPDSINTKVKYSEDISSQNIIFNKDSSQPVRFLNYQNPLRSIEKLK